MAAATMYVTAAGAGAKDGAAWASAFGEAEFEADLEGASEAGDIYYVKAGTYTLDGVYDSSARDATAVAPICIIGVKAATTNEPPVIGDWGAGTDRPLFACGTYSISLGDYYKLFNVQLTGTPATLLAPGSYTVAYNCKATNSYAVTATRIAFAGGTTTYISCEGIGADSTHGVAFNGTSKLLFCYAHDANVGIDTASTGSAYLFNIIDTCTTGVNQASDDIVLYFGNTIYNCTTGVSATDAHSTAGINNIIDTVTDGFLWTTQTNINFFAYNHVGNSVTDMWDLVAETAPHGDMWVTGGAGADPHFTDEANGNFSLETDSPCLDAGMAMTLGVG